MTSPERPTRLPDWLTTPASRVYAREVARRNRRFDRGIGVQTVPVLVVSVGNLSAGGTGKTPMVRWVVAALREAGHTPAVAMRGYRASPGEPSDEQAEHTRAMPGVAVIADPDRANAVLGYLRDHPAAGVDVIVLDDGFQHRRLARDLDIVLIDASRPPAADALIPRGFLREPVSALSRAHAVVLTHAEMVPAGRLATIWSSLESHMPTGTVRAVAEHTWTGLNAHHSSASSTPLPLEWLRGRRVAAVCAIGNPLGFLSALKRAGAEVVHRTMLPDHDVFAPATVEALRRSVVFASAEALVTTAKDWTKLEHRSLGLTVPVIVPDLSLRISQGAESLRTRLQEATRGAHCVRQCTDTGEVAPG